MTVIQEGRLRFFFPEEWPVIKSLKFPKPMFFLIRLKEASIKNLVNYKIP